MGTYKRLPREKEKPINGLATWLDHTYHWLEINWRVVLASIGSIAVITTVILIIANYSGNRDERARDLFYKAEQAVIGTDDAIAAYENVLKTYPSSGVAALSRLKLGDIYYSKGDYIKALEYLNPLAGASNDTIRILSLHNIAANKSAMGQPKEAAEVFLKAYKDVKNPAKGLSYFNAGLSYEASGNIDEAKKIFEELSKEETSFSTQDLREKSKEKLIWMAVNKEAK